MPFITPISITFYILCICRSLKSFRNHLTLAMPKANNPQGKSKRLSASGQSFPIELILKLCPLCNNPLFQKYPYSLQSSSIYECGFLHFRMDFHIGHSTPTIHIVSNVCPFPIPIISIGIRVQVSPMYVQAHLFAPVYATLTNVLRLRTNRTHRLGI